MSQITDERYSEYILTRTNRQAEMTISIGHATSNHRTIRQSEQLNCRLHHRRVVFLIEDRATHRNFTLLSKHKKSADSYQQC